MTTGQLTKKEASHIVTYSADSCKKSCHSKHRIVWRKYHNYPKDVGKQNCKKECQLSAISTIEIIALPQSYIHKCIIYMMEIKIRIEIHYFLVQFCIDMIIICYSAPIHIHPHNVISMIQHTLHPSYCQCDYHELPVRH